MTAHFVELLDALQRRSLRMATLVEDILQEALEAAFHDNEKLARRVIRRDQEVDSEEVQIEAEAVRLMALYQPVGSDLRLLCTVLKVNNDLERIADCGVNIAERAEHLDRQAVGDQVKAVREMAAAVQRMLRIAVQAYSDQDADGGQKVPREDDAVDAIYAQIIRSVVAEAARSPDSVAAYLDILSIAKNLERIADHATNIAEDVVFLSTGEIVRHEQL
jgi:phosphate transport system protein